MKRPVVLDTDASSMLIKQRLPPTLHAKLTSAQPLMTFVTCAELVKWVLVRDLGSRRRSEVTAWAEKTPFLEGDEAAAHAYARLAADAKRRGRPKQANDMWIAACCISQELPLATVNVKDFHDFAVHNGLELITP